MNRFIDEQPLYCTHFGEAYVGDSRELLAKLPDDSVNLVMTSPPFALLRKKAYGNEDQSEYVAWLGEFAALVRQKLKNDGSFVLDLGGAYRKGVPSRSLYIFRVWRHLCDDIGFHIAEDFIGSILQRFEARSHGVRHQKCEQRTLAIQCAVFRNHISPKRT